MSRRRKKGIIRRSIRGLILLAVLLAIAAVGISFHVKNDSKDLIIGKMQSEGYLKPTDISPAEDLHNADFRDFDCILVLGAAVQPNGYPSPMLKDRLDLAIYLFNQGAADKILVSGDNGQVEYNEVRSMEGYLHALGIPDGNISCDYAGFSTYDSMYRAKHIFGAERVLVVTQTYHIYRALYIGSKLGLDIYGASADQRHYQGQINRDLREILARDKDYLMCIFKPEASVMGDPEEL